MFRCQILINGISYEATDDLKNWDDFGISQKRSNYDRGYPVFLVHNLNLSTVPTSF